MRHRAPSAYFDRITEKMFAETIGSDHCAVANLEMPPGPRPNVLPRTDPHVSPPPLPCAAPQFPKMEPAPPCPATTKKGEMMQMGSSSDERDSWQHKYMRGLKDLPIDLMLMKRDAEVEVLTEVPMISLNQKGGQSFLLDCSRIDHASLFVDNFGYWNHKKKRSSTKWYDLDENGTVVKGPAVYRLRKAYSMHPSTVPEEALVKVGFVIYLRCTGQTFGYAMLSYDVRTPCEVVNTAHGNCKQFRLSSDNQLVHANSKVSMKGNKRKIGIEVMQSPKRMHSTSRFGERAADISLASDLGNTLDILQTSFPNHEAFSNFTVESETDQLLKRVTPSDDSFVRISRPSHMVPTVEQLLVGYTAESGVDSDWCSASGSVTLVIDGTHKILVDCGNPWNGQQLLSELRRRSLQADDITDVVVTHGHSDHCGNLSMFQSSRIYMDGDCAKPCARYITFQDGFKLTQRVSIIRTPGHTDNDLSVVVNETVRGCVVIAGDIFEDGEADKWQPNSRYEDEQRQSRARITALADWIVPGHGTVFRNKSKGTEDNADDTSH